MSYKRVMRISQEIMKIVSGMIRNDIKDPRISKMTSITKVEVTTDLRYAKIFFSVLGNDKEKKETQKGLESSKGFIRKGIGEELNLRYTPEPLFALDESIEHGVYISQLIDKVKKEDKDSE